MVIKLVVQVQLDTMVTKVLYPRDEDSEERVALLTGIVQLVSTALERGGSSDLAGKDPHYMKSDKGVVGYIYIGGGNLIICEADNEGEAGDVLRAVAKSKEETEDGLRQSIEKIVKKRGREMSSLWDME